MSNNSDSTTNHCSSLPSITVIGGVIFAYISIIGYYIGDIFLFNYLRSFSIFSFALDVPINFIYENAFFVFVNELGIYEWLLLGLGISLIFIPYIVCNVKISQDEISKHASMWQLHFLSLYTYLIVVFVAVSILSLIAVYNNEASGSALVLVGVTCLLSIYCYIHGLIEQKEILIVRWSVLLLSLFVFWLFSAKFANAALQNARKEFLHTMMYLELEKPFVRGVFKSVWSSNIRPETKRYLEKGCFHVLLINNNSVYLMKTPHLKDKIWWAPFVWQANQKYNKYCKDLSAQNLECGREHYEYSYKEAYDDISSDDAQLGKLIDELREVIEVTLIPIKEIQLTILPPNTPYPMNCDSESTNNRTPNTKH
ncbi:MAG: hypothetical protein HQL69_20250 [Magnetococcales bacterium]|nr:hypothetical protein [Magnetococcales bacterium]